MFNCASTTFKLMQRKKTQWEYLFQIRTCGKFMKVNKMNIYFDQTDLGKILVDVL